LFKYYGQRRAVGPLSCRIEAGEVVGLLGLNGAGKTTTLRILACDLLPSGGSVSVDGIDVVAQPERVRSLIGYLSDTPPLYDEMKVGAYLKFAAELRRVPKADVQACVEDAARLTGLTHVLGDPITSLSHGYRQRVGIAQAIVHKPKLVVLDEPSSGLDPVQIKEMRSLVRGLGEKHTVLVSSHNLPEISQMCDRLLVIGDGTIVASGTEAELVRTMTVGESIELTVLLAPGWDADKGAAWLKGLAEVKAAELVKSRDLTPGAVTYAVLSEHDVRAQLAAAVVGAGHSLLGLGKSERELESVFGKLAQGRESEAA
jgi:ABC-2 type transport system ATP-binding protein